LLKLSKHQRLSEGTVLSGNITGLLLM